jgi:hypothetical protein
MASRVDSMVKKLKKFTRLPVVAVIATHMAAISNPANASHATLTTCRTVMLTLGKHVTQRQKLTVATAQDRRVRQSAGGPDGQGPELP